MGDYVQRPCITHRVWASQIFWSIHLKSTTGPGRPTGHWPFLGLPVSKWVRLLADLTVASLPSAFVQKPAPESHPFSSLQGCDDLFYSVMFHFRLSFLLRPQTAYSSSAWHLSPLCAWQSSLPVIRIPAHRSPTLEASLVFLLNHHPTVLILGAKSCVSLCLGGGTGWALGCQQLDGEW